MKILQLISSLGLYGAERIVLELSAELKQRGTGVIIVNLFDPEKSYGSVIGRAERLGLLARGLKCRGRFDPAAVLSLRRFIAQNGINVVHSHGYKADFYAWCARQGSDVRLVATCHNWLGRSLTMKGYQWLDKRILNGFDRVVAVSETLRAEIEGAGIRKERVELIHNGLSMRDSGGAAGRPAADIRTVLGLKSGERMVTAVGRLCYEKGYGFLIDAAPVIAARCPDARIVIAGDGPLRPYLTSKTRMRGLADRIIFAGERDDIPAILAASDVFVMPSISEGMPVALLEAMAACKAIVASRVGEIPEMIRDRTEGLLAAPGDPDQLAAAVIRFLSDPEYALSCGQRAGLRFTRSFSADKMTESYLALYRHIVPGVTV